MVNGEKFQCMTSEGQKYYSFVRPISASSRGAQKHPTSQLKGRVFNPPLNESQTLAESIKNEINHKLDLSKKKLPSNSGNIPNQQTAQGKGASLIKKPIIINGFNKSSSHRTSRPPSGRIKIQCDPDGNTKKYQGSSQNFF